MALGTQLTPFYPRRSQVAPNVDIDETRLFYVSEYTDLCRTRQFMHWLSKRHPEPWRRIPLDSATPLEAVLTLLGN